MSTTNALDISKQEQRIAERVNPDITKALTISRDAGGVRFVNAEQVTEFAKFLAISKGGVRKHLRGDVGACLAIVVQSIEWGLSPFAVANKSYFVNDQIAYESQLVQAVILRRAPIIGRIKFRFTGEGPNRVCIASATLKDGTGDVEYESPKFSLILPKNSPLWKSDPDQQHCYYSGRALCRRHFPDVLLGIYAEDEIFQNGELAAEAPKFAKDVTPSRSISSKLDDLSGIGGHAQAAAVDDQQEVPTDSIEHEDAHGAEGGTEEDGHDPETGEVEMTPRERVIGEIREEIIGGATAMRAISMRDEDDRALLTDDDRAELKAFWKSRQQPDGRARQPEQADA